MKGPSARQLSWINHMMLRAETPATCHALDEFFAIANPANIYYFYAAVARKLAS